MEIKEFVLADVRTGDIFRFSSLLVQLLKQRNSKMNCMGYVHRLLLTLFEGWPTRLMFFMVTCNHYTNLKMFMELYMDDV